MYLESFYGVILKSVIILLILFISCNRNEKDTFAISDITPMAVLYHQKAAEVKAMQLQVYNMVSNRLKRIKKEFPDVSKMAIVIDIDETVLDNSPYNAKQIFTKTAYPTGWDDWVKLEIAKPIPGSLSFLKLADEFGFKIFYISNRKNHLFDATVNNLTKFGYPQLNKDQILLRTGSSDKEPRRKAVRVNHSIIAYIGDNLGDFSSEFDHVSWAERDKSTDNFSRRFGDQFFILPNSLYGGWLESILQESDTTDLLKAKRIKSELYSYD